MNIEPQLPNSLKLQQGLKIQSESYWLERGDEMALKLFKTMADRVPAYKDFLKKHRVDPEKIQTIADFKQVPPIDKQNYLRAYPRQSLVWDGDFKKQSWVFSTTSGSTGEPFYFPRTAYQDQIYALTAELYLRENFNIDKKSTLYIVGFPMGAWIGGVFTYEALQRVADNPAYCLSIITPGINKLEIIKAVKNLGSDFDQIVIGSYAPFLKDILDDGERMGLNWKEYNLGFIFSAEGFSETFRDYVIAKTGLKNTYKDTLNHYGIVDLGTVSHETPLTILLRRLALADENVYEAVFKQTLKLPTLTQYLPELFYFEDDGGKLMCSSYSGIPLVRYDLKDNGGVVSLSLLKAKLKEVGLDLEAEVRKAGIDQTLWNVPLVYVYERSDFSVSFFAFQVYPETIRKVLIEPEFEKYFTGKFTMITKFDANSDQYLEINVEKKPEIFPPSSLSLRLTRQLVARLKQENSEYRKTAEEYPDRVIPKLVFWEYEDEAFFKPGTKQKWVKKE